MNQIRKNASASLSYRPHALLRVTLVVACGLAACLALVAPAGATVVHQEEGSFKGADRPSEGSFPGGAFQYSLPSDAVDRSSGDVWVTEGVFEGFAGKGNVVDKFSDKGVYAEVQLTGSTTPQKSFNFGFGIFSGVAVDNSSAHKGALYVADTFNHVVDRFSESGSFECQITGKTPSSAEEIAHECDGATGSLTPDGSIEPAGLAVDSSGGLYVADSAHETIDKFGPSGQYVSQITNAQTGNHLGTGFGLGTIALDSAGDVYATNVESNVVKLQPSGSLAQVIAEGKNPTGIGVDPENDHLYVSQKVGNEQGLVEYEPSAGGDVQVDVVASGQAYPQVAGLAVGTTGKLYASEFLNFSGAAKVLMYSPDIVVPNVTTTAATEVQETTATLNGQVDPDVAHKGPEVVSCQFEYGLTTAYGETAPCVPGPSYAAPQDVSARVEGLQPKSIYHFRVEAANANGIPGYGEDATFPTHGLPSIDRQVAESHTTSATVLAKINPWGQDTTCQVQYVADVAFARSGWADATAEPCKPADIGAGSDDVRVRFKISGLARETAYHYRFVASNQAGLVVGPPNGTFETYGIDRFNLEELKSSLINTSNNNEWEPGELERPQAGVHPYEIASTIELSHATVLSEYTQANPPYETEFRNWTSVNTKDIHVELPPGLVGNPTALPRCNRYLVAAERCPGDTQVGRIELWVDGNPAFGGQPLSGGGRGGENNPNRPPDYADPLYNLEPSGRYPAEFGAFVEGEVGAWIPFHIRTGGDYGVTADSIDISGVAIPQKIRVRVWGVPADPSHNADRVCHQQSLSECNDQPLKPFLRNPTSCGGPQTAMATADSWEEQGQFVRASTALAGFGGCGELLFEPTFEAQPTTDVADSATGLDVDLKVPQPEGCREEEGKVECQPAEADVKDVKVTLPAGVTIDPSSADGLAACSEAQIGYLPQKSAEVGHPQFTPDPAECPDAAKIGSVKVKTPLLGHELEGAVYVAAQEANPFRSLLALYITVYDAETGVVIKLPGKVSLDPVTGQLTTTVDEDPQLPFEDFKLDFFKGSRAALTTPFTCGSYSTTTGLTPWSAPEGKVAEPSSLPFSVTGPNGGACVNSEGQAPNAPVFEAGTASPVAATYSPFVLHLKREDGSQRLSGLNVTLPPGLTGKIAGLEQCPQSAIEAAIARSHERDGAAELAHPSCPSGSEVGVVHVGVGSGAPFYETGYAYFTGPYKGAPFSLVIVTPAVAGPFDLGTVVVRAALFIDPYTAQVTVKSDPFPTIIDGIPLEIRSVNVDMNRGEFTLNPTSCSVMSVTGQEASTAGQTAGLSDRFQAGGCTTLPFHPVLKASTSAKTSRREGASLRVRVSSSLGQANIAKVHVTLPKQLPSRLQTLKLACPASVFAANPASCPTASVVGAAVAHTPILSSPLTGPAYIVSHGGAAFPDLEIVLQGEGVTIILDGKTNIKNGITESSFQSVPDAPVSSFELSLPEGPHSIIAAPHGRLCSLAARTVLVKRQVTVRVKKHGRVRRRRVTRTVRRRVAAGLLMPTTITGQNGAVIRQKTRIGVTGCTSSIVKHRKKGHAKHKKHKGNKRGK